MSHPSPEQTVIPSGLRLCGLLAAGGWSGGGARSRPQGAGQSRSPLCVPVESRSAVSKVGTSKGERVIGLLGFTTLVRNNEVDDCFG